MRADQERERLLAAEQEQRELAEALEEMAAIVSSTLDVEQVLDRILEQVERVVGECGKSQDPIRVEK